ncbi:MAG: ABC transporter permease, partial [Deltaproteobacteria bacterium]|nr:ABC transporter permease [Deltaproteobacteria bacterium]
MGLLLRLAWRNIWRNRRRTLITVGAMGFGLAFCMGMVAFLDGFVTEMFRAMVTESVGHVQIHQRDYPAQRVAHNAIADSQELLQQLAASPAVAKVAPRVYGATLLGASETSAGALIVGVDPRREASLNDLDQKIIRGRSLGPRPQGEIVVGHLLAKKLKVDVG